MNQGSNRPFDRRGDFNFLFHLGKLLPRNDPRKNSLCLSLTVEAESVAVLSNCRVCETFSPFFKRTVGLVGKVLPSRRIEYSVKRNDRFSTRISIKSNV